MKGLALDEVAYLIIAIILVSILLVIFFLFESPMMVFPIVLFDHLSTLVRGWVIVGTWAAIYSFIAIFGIVIWSSMANPSCWGPQAVGCAAKNAALTVAFTAILIGLAFHFTSAIPLAYHSIQLQVDNNTIDKNLAGWVMDTSYMTNAGDNDPLAGQSKNPIESFIISVTKGKVSLSDALDRLDRPTYSIYDKIAGKVWDDGTIMFNKNWYVSPFRVSLKISKTPDGKYVMNIINGSTYCTFNSGTFSWYLKMSKGKVTPQEGTFGCGGGKSYKIFVSMSDFAPNRFHVTIGKYSMDYQKLKNVIVIIKDGSPIYVVNNKNWKGTSSLKNIQVKHGAVIFLDYADTHNWASFYAKECGGNMNNVKEGVYICIPRLSG